MAGTRWVIEERLQGGQGRGGTVPIRGASLDRMVPAHHAGAAGPRLSGSNQVPCRCGVRKRGAVAREGLIPLTVPEIRRLLYRLLRLSQESAGLALGWSQWRRRHQARALRSHYKRRLQPFPAELRL